MGTEFSDMQIEVWANKEKVAKLAKEVEEMEEDVNCYPSDYRRYKPKVFERMHEVVDRAELEDVHIKITIPKETTYRDAQMIVHQRMVLELK
eukprot:4931685-Karenia_brevis.AAC.1